LKIKWKKLIGILLGTKRVLIINDKKNGAVAVFIVLLSAVIHFDFESRSSYLLK
jgi:hypothetical protein